MMTSAGSRFAGLAAARTQPRSLADTIVFSTERHVVAPTVGSILPFWLIVVPRYCTLNYADQPPATHAELPSIVSEMQARLHFDHAPIVFEHGPAQIRSDVGCGCDHAHVHLLWTEPDLAERIFTTFEERLHAGTSKTGLTGVHYDVDPKQPYYLAWHGGHRLLEQPTKRGASQFFRRLVAETAGCPDHWDYRTYPFLTNVRKTLGQIECLNQAA